jgi:hypothetical protein
MLNGKSTVDGDFLSQRTFKMTKKLNWTIRRFLSDQNHFVNEGLGKM